MAEAPTTLRQAISQHDITSIIKLIGNNKVSEVTVPVILKINPSVFPDDPTTTPAIEAVKSKCPELLYLLHCAGADFTRTDGNGRHALHHAALRNDTDAITLLSLANCPKDVRDNCGFTPLVMAIRNRHLESVRLLVEHGAVVYPAHGPLNSMPLVTAAYYGFPEILNFLLSVAEPNMKRKKAQMNYALCMACYAGQIDSVKLLVLKEAPVLRWHHTEKSPLEFAIMVDNREVASVLLRAGATVHDRDNLGYTPLMHAAVSNSPNVTSLLLVYGADSDQVANDGRTTVNTILKTLGNEAVAKVHYIWNNEIQPSK